MTGRPVRLAWGEPAPADLFDHLHRGDDDMKPPMVMRSIRVPLPLWEAAREKADAREENISDVLRAALERYVKRG